MIQRQLVASAFAALLALAGQAKAEELRAEVIHWWTSGGESAAVKVFADQFDAAGGERIDELHQRVDIAAHHAARSFHALNSW